jgi:hypothetical protein
LANDTIPPFTAEATITTEVFQKDGPISKIQQKAFFSYSNGWWEIECQFENGYSRGMPTNTLTGRLLNCKRIPDGIRLIVARADESGPILKSNVIQSAIVQPISIPNPGSADLLLCWLSLCPQPELPLIETNRMRRLVSSEFLSDSRNQGTYNIRYLSPSDYFVAELNITNDGVFVTADKSIQQFKPPFENGYREFTYRVEATTNISGILFPAHTALYKYVPQSDAKSQNDVRPAVVARLDLTRVNLSVEQLTRFPILIALDHRPTNLPQGVTVNYRVTNDQWVSVSNPKMKQLATLYRLIPGGGKASKTGISWFFATSLVILAVAPLIIFFAVKRKNKQTT